LGAASRPIAALQGERALRALGVSRLRSWGHFRWSRHPRTVLRHRPDRFVGLVHEDTGNHVVPGARMTTSSGGVVTRAPTHSPPLPVAGDSVADAASSGSAPRR